MTYPLYRILAAALAFAAASPAASNELTLDASSGFVIPVEVNGRTLRLKVDAGTPGYVVLNPQAAQAAGLKGSLLPVTAKIGPVKLEGKTRATGVVISGLRMRKRVVWLDRNIVEGADGVISPRELPHDRVEFRFGPERPGEVASEIPTAFRMDRGVHHLYEVAGRKVEISLSNVDPASFATASAAALLAASNGSKWAGEVEARPILFGVERSVRPMRLDRPVLLGRFEVRNFLVRTGDDRGAYSLPTDPAADPDEIVVTGSRKSKQKARVALDLGVDRLGRCSRMIYDKLAQRLTLWCVAAD
jgi:hypothetical protein